MLYIHFPNQIFSKRTKNSDLLNSSDLQRFPLQYQTKQQEESADAEAFTFPEDGQMIQKKSEPHYVTYWNETTTKKYLAAKNRDPTEAN